MAEFAMPRAPASIPRRNPETKRASLTPVGGAEFPWLRRRLREDAFATMEIQRRRPALDSLFSSLGFCGGWMPERAAWRIPPLTAPLRDFGFVFPRWTRDFEPRLLAGLTRSSWVIETPTR